MYSCVAFKCTCRAPTVFLYIPSRLTCSLPFSRTRHITFQCRLPVQVFVVDDAVLPPKPSPEAGLNPREVAEKRKNKLFAEQAFIPAKGPKTGPLGYVADYVCGQGVARQAHRC